jgi:hypothetical protein
MNDLGDGWFVRWNGPDVFTLIRGDHEFSFDAVMTGRRLWKTVHTVRLYEMSDHWDPPHERERLTHAEKNLLVDRARRVRGGWFCELAFVGEGV